MKKKYKYRVYTKAGMMFESVVTEWSAEEYDTIVDAFQTPPEKLKMFTDNGIVIFNIDSLKEAIFEISEIQSK